MNPAAIAAFSPKSTPKQENFIAKEVSHIGEITINSTFADFMTRRKVNVSPRTWAKDMHLYETYIRTAPISDKPLLELNGQDAYALRDERIAHYATND